MYVCMYVYMDLKSTHNLFKITNISLVFRSFIHLETNFKQKYR